MTAFILSARQQLPVAIAVILTGLKAHSAAVLSGHAKPSLPREPEPEPEPEPAPPLKLVEPPPMREVVALMSLKYYAQGATVVVGKMQRATMPAALAGEAIRSGAACDIGDKRVAGGQIGSWGMLQPLADHCEWVGPPADQSRAVEEHCGADRVIAFRAA